MSPLDERISGAELEAVVVCVSEFSTVLELCVVTGIVEAAKVDARRVGKSSLAGVELCLEGLLNHELPQENKPAEGTKEAERKERAKSGEREKCKRNKHSNVTNNVKIILWIRSALPRETKQTLLSCLSFFYHSTDNIYSLLLLISAG